MCGLALLALGSSRPSPHTGGDDEGNEAAAASPVDLLAATAASSDWTDPTGMPPERQPVQRSMADAAPGPADRPGADTAPGDPDAAGAVGISDPAPEQPLAIRIPDLEVDSTLPPLGLLPDRTLEVPVDPMQAGWFRHRAVPGEPGAAVIVGHVDSHTGPGIFHRLGTLSVGDRIEVDRDDGTTAHFRVVAVESHDKDDFPTERVYGPTDDELLRVITCGGDFDTTSRSYEENVVVFAELVGIVSPETGVA